MTDSIDTPLCCRPLPVLPNADVACCHAQVKALWMWLQETGAKIATIGTWGPLPNTDSETMIAEVRHGFDLRHQSAGFLVISKPGSQTAMWKR